MTEPFVRRHRLPPFTGVELRVAGPSAQTRVDDDTDDGDPPDLNDGDDWEWEP